MTSHQLLAIETGIRSFYRKFWNMHGKSIIVKTQKVEQTSSRKMPTSKPQVHEQELGPQLASTPACFL